jgi:hypothetical protein
MRRRLLADQQDNRQADGSANSDETYQECERELGPQPVQTAF